MKKLILSVAMGAFVCLGAMSAAFAQSDCSKLIAPSPFGPTDQVGATNRITPAVTKAAASEIQEGKVIALSNPLEDGVPLFGTRFSKTVLSATSLVPGAEYGENKLTFMEDTNSLHEIMPWVYCTVGTATLPHSAAVLAPHSMK